MPFLLAKSTACITRRCALMAPCTQSTASAKQKSFCSRVARQAEQRAAAHVAGRWTSAVVGRRRACRRRPGGMLLSTLAGVVLGRRQPCETGKKTRPTCISMTSSACFNMALRRQ